MVSSPGTGGIETAYALLSDIIAIHDRHHANGSADKLPMSLMRRRIEQRPNHYNAIFATRNGTWHQVGNIERRGRTIRADTGFDWVTPHTFRIFLDPRSRPRSPRRLHKTEATPSPIDRTLRARLFGLTCRGEHRGRSPPRRGPPHLPRTPCAVGPSAHYCARSNSWRDARGEVENCSLRVRRRDLNVAAGGAPRA